MIKRTITIIAMLCLMAGSLMPVLAQHEGDVVIGQELVLRVRFAAGGLTVQERAGIITKRINDLLGSREFNPADVTVGVRNKEHVVMIHNAVIVTADRRTAEFNMATPQQLANMWAANLRRAIPRAKAEPVQ